MRTLKNKERKIPKPKIEPSIKMERSSGNVFKDLGFSDAEAESLSIRCSLMIEIEKTIKQKRWTQAQAAKALGVVQPRISELFHGKINRFTVDTLLEYLSILGKKVTFTIKNKAAA